MERSTLIIIITLAAIAVLSVYNISKMRSARKRRELDAPPAEKPGHKPSGTVKMAELPPEIQSAVSQGQKLQAVKFYKEYYGCTLSEANSAIDSLISAKN